MFRGNLYHVAASIIITTDNPERDGKMEYRQLYYFVCIAKEGSFSRVADKVMVSQSSLSRAIQHLEEEFNIQLINRTTRSFELTPAGKELLERGEKIVDNFNSLETYLRSYSSNDSGEIRLGIPPVLNTIMAPFFIPDFNKQHPNVKMDFTVEGSKLIQRDVLAGQLDVGLIIRPANENLFNICDITSGRLVLLVPASHALASQKEVSIHALENEPLIMLDSTYQLFENVVMACRIAGFEPNIVHCSPSWDYIVELVSLSQGITILPSPIIPHMQKRLDLVSISLTGSFAEWDVITVTKKGTKVPANVKSLIKHLVATYN